MNLGRSKLRQPNVYIIILNWNGWCDTLECLASLKELHYDNFRIVVVDNASSDGSEERIRRAYPDIVVIQSGANLGFAGGNNLGIQYALCNRAEYIWLLNNDTVVDPQALSHLIARMRQKPDVGMCGSKLIYFNDREKVQALGGASYNKWLATVKNIGGGTSSRNPVSLEKIESRLSYIVGASLLVSRSFVETVGLLNEEYFLYFEEIDWITRAKGKFKMSVALDSIVYHKEGSSTGGNGQLIAKKSKLADYYSIRNRLRFTRRFFPEALPSVYLMFIGVVMNRIRRRQWDRIGLLWKALWAK